MFNVYAVTYCSQAVLRRNASTGSSLLCILISHDFIFFPMLLLHFYHLLSLLPYSFPISFIYQSCHFSCAPFLISIILSFLHLPPFFYISFPYVAYISKYLFFFFVVILKVRAFLAQAGPVVYFV